ncbi:MAG: iron-sulfur cluster assembly scaffold protein [Lentisphaeria bacterium]|nr:iron-sulfur cluster assembly scaffold protein [Lentisphaeria bacterium]
MAKNSLVGGAMWEQYSNIVTERMNDPKHMGEFSEEDAKARNAKLIVADYGAEACGDSVRLYWLVDEATETVIDACFKSFGCGTAIASSDMMVELCIGKTVDEALAITNLEVEAGLRDTPDKPAVPPQKMHCSVMAYDVIKKAVSLYKGVDLSTLETEQIICECARVSLGNIEDAIRVNDLRTVEQITTYTKAGAFCKSCVRPGGHEEKEIYLVDILARVRAEMDEEKLEEISFDDLSIIKQISALETVLDAEVRPALARDAGGLTLEDIKQVDGSFIVFIKYMGACSGCNSSLTGTLNFIESVLQERLSENIFVRVV